MTSNTIFSATEYLKGYNTFEGVVIYSLFMNISNKYVICKLFLKLIDFRGQLKSILELVFIVLLD